MGPYCQYCDRRCFVERRIVVGGEIVWDGIMATCPRGRERDRQVLGQDFREAVNPRDPR